MVGPGPRTPAPGADPIGILEPIALVQAGLITFLAAIVHSVAGFGFTLVAVTFFLLIVGSGDAISLLIIVNLALSLILVPRLWRDVERVLLTRLAVGTLLGVPIGLAAFGTANVDVLRLSAALVIVSFAALLAFAPARVTPVRGEHRWGSAVGVGMAAGAMAVALGMPGPPVVIYLAGIGLEKQPSRATMLTLFTLSYGASLALRSATVGVSRDVWVAGGMLIPAAAAGALVGHVLAGRIGEEMFRRGVLALVGLTGLYMLLDVLLR